MKWNWKKDKNYGDGGYHAKNGMIELQVWQVWDTGYGQDPVWLTAVDIKISKEDVGTLYPKNHHKLEKAKQFAEKAAEDWVKKLNKSLK
jgi:hypothetical protein